MFLMDMRLSTDSSWKPVNMIYIYREWNFPFTQNNIVTFSLLSFPLRFNKSLVRFNENKITKIYTIKLNSRMRNNRVKNIFIDFSLFSKNVRNRTIGQWEHAMFSHSYLVSLRQLVRYHCRSSCTQPNWTTSWCSHPGEHRPAFGITACV